MTKPITPCWDHNEIQVATQIDVGSLEFGDAVADAVFAAVHQAVPVARRSRVTSAEPIEVSQDEVLADFCQPLTSNEPHLRFITGKAGTGKSHLVRWLKSKIPDNQLWQVIYIEKRNTSLRRIIEQILADIHTPAVDRLRQDLRAAATELTGREAAELALLNKLHQLLEHDKATEIEGTSPAEAAAARPTAARLVGDYTFKHQLMKKSGPVERITELALHGARNGADVEPEDLIFTGPDLFVDVDEFIDAGAEVLRNVKRLVKSDMIRAATAALMNHYLPRAKAEVFTGQSADLIDVFCDVRRELANQGKELCLFIEDLVLLNSIDTQLAQALTLPASRELCKIRAVIAVTSGHLEKYTTFADRGVHYTMDLGRSSVEDADLRDLVGRYLNVGRVHTGQLVGTGNAPDDVPNKCTDCPVRERCHDAFGASRLGHGYFPFNANALDRMINLASPEGFDPRNILREVIRAPLEVAEDELERSQFPSARLAATFTDARIAVPYEMRDALNRRATSPQQEITLRALYASEPPMVDEELRKIAGEFDVLLTDLGEQVEAPAPVRQSPGIREREIAPIEAWITKGTRLPATPARAIRTWFLDAVFAQLQDGPVGLPVKRTRKGPVYELTVGSVRVHGTAIVIENSAGAGAAGSTYGGPLMEFAANESDGVLLAGILGAEEDSASLVGPDAGHWQLQVQKRVTQFAQDLADYARAEMTHDPTPAIQLLGVLRAPIDRAIGSPSAALGAMVRAPAVSELSPAVREFLQKAYRHRGEALRYLSDRYAARKGEGAWTLIDAGAILRILMPSAALRELPILDEKVHHELDQSLRAVRDMQVTASREAWRPVRDELERLDAYVGDESDYPGAAIVMDAFAKNAHQVGVLGHADAYEQYRELRSQATNAAFATHERLAKVADGELGAALLWELAEDPVPTLRALRTYWHRCQQLLDDARLTPPARPQDSEVFDRARLRSAFRALAEALEEDTSA